MARQHTFPITNGVGSKALVNGNYSVTSSTLGYDDTTILPITQEVIEGTNDYSFTIAATGTLTIHVTDDGTITGNPIEGASFARCDSNGNTYGNLVVSNGDGNAIFNAVPFDAGENPPIIYYKQTDSDGEHTYSEELQNTTLTEQTKTIELANAIAPIRNLNFTDATYNGLPISDGNIILTESE